MQYFKDSYSCVKGWRKILKKGSRSIENASRGGGKNKEVRMKSEIREICISLAEFSAKGNYPPELERFEVRTFREIHFNTYRIIYQIIEKKVFIHCILD